jgi:hypothetical protein
VQEEGAAQALVKVDGLQDRWVYSHAAHQLSTGEHSCSLCCLLAGNRWFVVLD